MLGPDAATGLTVHDEGLPGVPEVLTDVDKEVGRAHRVAYPDGELRQAHPNHECRLGVLPLGEHGLLLVVQFVNEPLALAVGVDGSVETASDPPSVVSVGVVREWEPLHELLWIAPHVHPALNSLLGHLPRRPADECALLDELQDGGD